MQNSRRGKSLYRKLAKQYHPDNGGDARIIQEINEEYSEWWSTHKDIHYSQDTGNVYEETENRTQETAEEFIEIIEILRNLDWL